MQHAQNVTQARPFSFAITSKRGLTSKLPIHLILLASGQEAQSPANHSVRAASRRYPSLRSHSTGSLEFSLCLVTNRCWFLLCKGIHDRSSARSVHRERARPVVMRMFGCEVVDIMIKPAESTKECIVRV